MKASSLGTVDSNRNQRRRSYLPYGKRGVETPNSNPGEITACMDGSETGSEIGFILQLNGTLASSRPRLWNPNPPRESDTKNNPPGEGVESHCLRRKTSGRCQLQLLSPAESTRRDL